MKTASLEWAAGFFDGHGSVALSERPRLAVRCADEELVRAFAAVARCGKVYGPYKNPGRRRPTFMWLAEGREAEGLVDRLLPLLHSHRREQIRQVFHRGSSRR